MIDAPTLPQQHEPGLRHYFDVIRRRFWIILAVLAACVGAAMGVTTLQENVYRATTKLVVGQGGGLPQVQYGNEVQTFTATMSELVRSNVVAENVIGNLRLEDETAESLLSRITTSINPQTAVITVAVEDNDPQQATRIAQEIALVFSQLVRERFSAEGGGDTSSEPPTVAIFDPAHVLPTRVSPRPVRNVAAAILLGLVLGLVAAFLREHFDRAVRTREDVERAFGVSVIGQVPFVRLKRGERGGITWTDSGPVAEAFRALRANLQYLGIKRPLQTVLVTSAAPEQGKTTITANLAVAIARSGASVAVIEGDLRRPRLDAAFGTDAGPGLTNVLVGAADLDSAIRQAPLRGTASGHAAFGEIALLPSGPLPPNPAELLSSFQMRDILDRLSQRYDYVLIDSPPLLAVADALELARMVDGVVLAVRRNRARTDDAQELRSIIERLEINVVGAVLTDVEAGAGYGYEADERRARVDEAQLAQTPRPRRTESPQPARAGETAQTESPFTAAPAPAALPADPRPEPEPVAREDF